jgi:hypothetical protein
MLRRLIGVAIVFALFVGVALADEIRVVITKVDADTGKVSYKEIKDKGKNAKPSEEVTTVSAAKDLKVNKGKFNKDTKKFEAGDAIENGLKNEMFGKIGDKGIPAMIDSDGKEVKAITVTGGKKK